MSCGVIAGLVDQMLCKMEFTFLTHYSESSLQLRACLLLLKYCSEMLCEVYDIYLQWRRQLEILQFT